ncbi:MAG: helix-turn-helix transcriptional regulator [Bacteroidales bacterium]|nr:helix-turn-helix transcriptional regulator [Bacteroidales bacterium]
MKRDELLKSEGYWIAKLQTDLYRELVSFMEKTHKNGTQLANYLGCSKGYISQLLNGNFDHKLSKLVRLSLALGKAPILEYRDLSDYILENDETFSSVMPPASLEKLIKKNLFEKTKPIAQKVK